MAAPEYTPYFVIDRPQHRHPPRFCDPFLLRAYDERAPPSAKGLCGACGRLYVFFYLGLEFELTGCPPHASKHLT